MKQQKKELYKTLGVKPDASAAEIKRARRLRAEQAHPDKKGDSHEEMTQINHAFDVLSDPARRLLYDQTGEDRIASKETRARELVMQSFLDALTKDAPLILKHATEFIQNAKQNIKKMKGDGERALKSLKERREKIRSKGPMNAFHMVVDKNIEQIEQRLASMDLDLEMCDEALKELKNYSSDEKLITAITPQALAYFEIDLGSSTAGGSW